MAKYRLCYICWVCTRSLILVVLTATVLHVTRYSIFVYFPSQFNSDIALIKNNAKVGGQIACELSLLRRQSPQGQGSTEGSFTSYPGHRSDAECKGSRDGSSKKTMKKPSKHGDIVSTVAT